MHERRNQLMLAVGASVMPLVTRTATSGGKRVQVFSGEHGVVTEAARDIYGSVTVRFEGDLVIRYLAHEVVPVQGACPFDLRTCIVLKTRIGSHAHGIARPDSDDDFRGVFVAPAELHWSLHETPRRIEYLRDGLDELYYEIGGFVRRVLIGDPMAVETLFSDLIEFADPVGTFLLEHRNAFLARQTLLGFPTFLREQLRELNRRRRRNKRIKPKALMHSYRLATSALRALRTGVLSLDMREHAEALIAIREGQWHFDKVNQAVHTMLHEFDAAFDDSPLPDRADFGVVDECLIFARAEFARRYLA